EGRDIGKEPAHRRTRLGLARSFQIPKPFASMSVLDNLRIPLVYAARQHENLSKSQATDEALHILRQVGLGDKVHAMSGGLTQVDMRKLELARAMARCGCSRASRFPSTTARPSRCSAPTAMARAR